MPFYGFKLNPKQLVEAKAKRLFGRNVKVNVRGSRLSPLDSKRLDVTSGTYYVECDVDGKGIAIANNKNWRKAYALLVIEVEKAFERSLQQPGPV